VPVAIAFRTTNKAGALVALAYALLFGFGGAELLRRANPRLPLAFPWRAALAGGVAVVLAVAVMPAWTGGLYPLRYLIPDYWRQLARDVNAGPAGSRVLLAPGTSNVAYRWAWRDPTT
jgi:arabinofuranan 3-O-arabinosyltransferase